ncbi:MAG: methionyl-tRNA synthetase [Patescibacteria group bacterium]|nr:methionyl-tRNA synthetase [Patescibacteria group bacterium]
MKSFYITTTLPYVNAEPHVGFAMEIIRADVIARSKKLQGYDIFFNTGTDEHGIKVHRNAVAVGVDPQKYVDELSVKFKDLVPLLGISPDIHFIRTTDTGHKLAAQAFWKMCKEKGFIYKKNYKIKYCIGCELEKTESELVEGKCPIHPLMSIEEIEEENYFFKFSEFQKPLLDLYAKNPNFVVPSFRFNEIKAFVERGLQDFSISRLKIKMPWGVEVPDDKDHVMYVWFDALVDYISTLGWPDNQASFKKYWVDSENVVQYCGKDNLRQQSAMWQSMLMSVGLPNSRQIVINGFITGEGGIKMSKSLGNVINPVDLVKEYGADALRLYLLKEVHPFEDSPFTLEKFKEAYNAHLANGLGNLVSRVMKMAESNGVILDEKAAPALDAQKHADFFASFEINKVCDDIWSRIQETDKFIQEYQPFKTIKIDAEKGKQQISFCLASIFHIAKSLEAILPETSKIILEGVKSGKMPEKPLFMRK